MHSLGGKLGLCFIATSILVSAIVCWTSTYTVTSCGVVEDTYVAANSYGSMCNYAKVTVDEETRVIPISAELYGKLRQGDIVDIIDTYRRDYRCYEKVRLLEDVK